MKKQILTIAAVAALVVSSMSTAIADDSGTLTVTGDISNGTCTVPAGDLTKSITFGSLNSKDVTALKEWEFAVTPVQVDLHVSGCDNTLHTAAVQLGYTQDAKSANKGYGMANAEPTATAEIGLVPVFVRTAAKAVKGNSTWTKGDLILAGANSNTASLASGAATVSFWMNAMKTKDTVVAGKFDGTVNLSMVYK